MTVRHFPYLFHTCFPQLHGKKRHIRPLVIARIHLQHEVCSIDFCCEAAVYLQTFNIAKNVAKSFECVLMTVAIFDTSNFILGIVEKINFLITNYLDIPYSCKYCELPVKLKSSNITFVILLL